MAKLQWLTSRTYSRANQHLQGVRTLPVVTSGGDRETQRHALHDQRRTRCSRGPPRYRSRCCRGTKRDGYSGGRSRADRDGRPVRHGMRLKSTTRAPIGTLPHQNQVYGASWTWSKIHLCELVIDKVYEVVVTSALYLCVRQSGQMDRCGKKFIAAFVRSVQQPEPYRHEHELVLRIKSHLFIQNLAVGLGRTEAELLIHSSSCPSVQ